MFKVIGTNTKPWGPRGNYWESYKNEVINLFRALHTSLFSDMQTYDGYFSYGGEEATQSHPLETRPSLYPVDTSSTDTSLDPSPRSNIFGDDVHHLFSATSPVSHKSSQAFGFYSNGSQSSSWESEVLFHGMLGQSASLQSSVSTSSSAESEQEILAPVEVGLSFICSYRAACTQFELLASTACDSHFWRDRRAACVQMQSSCSRGSQTYPFFFARQAWNHSLRCTESRLQVSWRPRRFSVCRR